MGKMKDRLIKLQETGPVGECSKCGGFLYREWDNMTSEWDYHCLNCGNVLHASKPMEKPAGRRQGPNTRGIKL